MARHEKKRPRVAEMLPVPAELFLSGGKYPDQIRVSFTDGSTQIYELRVQQPHPVILRNLEIIQGMQVGYPVKKDLRERINDIFFGKEAEVWER